MTDIETGKELLSREFKIDKNSSLILGRITLYYSDKGMLLIEWFIEDKRYINHYLYGMPAFDVEDYKRWLKKIK